MSKSREEVIALFNEQVNMSADELEKWLENPESKKAGTGVGLESGARILEILRSNPKGDPDAYTEVRGTHPDCMCFAPKLVYSLLAL
jgi:hypothetical protein